MARSRLSWRVVDGSIRAGDGRRRRQSGPRPGDKPGRPTVRPSGERVVTGSGAVGVSDGAARSDRRRCPQAVLLVLFLEREKNQ